MKYLLFAVIAFVFVDILVRMLLKSLQEKRARKERAELLEKSLDVDVSHEAPTLKQVRAKNPKARILCVDDEEIVLASFRKILVLDGYSIDTVESGPEALGLLHSHHYDFVFTDLKMPGMDGTEVARAVNEIRPDIDVVIITGYATVESAVACMKHGAIDYVQKPFSEDELLAFAEKLRAARRKRIKGELKPRVHITHMPSEAASVFDEFAIPGGVFIAPGHCWASVEPEGQIKVGMDDFARCVIGRIEDIELPNPSMKARQGMPLFSVRHGAQTIPFNAPLSGTVSRVNTGLLERLDELDHTTYGENWICELDADNLDTEMGHLKIGRQVVSFYQDDLENLAEFLGKTGGADGGRMAARPDDPSEGCLHQVADRMQDQIVQRFFQR